MSETRKLSKIQNDECSGGENNRVPKGKHLHRYRRRMYGAGQFPWRQATHDAQVSGSLVGVRAGRDRGKEESSRLSLKRSGGNEHPGELWRLWGHPHASRPGSRGGHQGDWISEKRPGRGIGGKVARVMQNAKTPRREIARGEASSAAARRARCRETLMAVGWGLQ